MSTSVSIHPQYRNDLTLNSGGYNPDNSDSVTLIFDSTEYHDLQPQERVFTVTQEVTLYKLDPATAELLHLVALADLDTRRAFVGHLRKALEIQSTTTEAANDG